MKTIAEALNLLILPSSFTLPQLKDAYRREIKQWHPDLNQHRLQQATEHCQRLNNAYDLLEASLEAKGASMDDWADWINRKMPEWEKSFRLQWRSAYQRSCHGEYPGLHFNTCIAEFRRGAIEPRPDWFLNCLFQDTAKNRAIYREHLLKIAPNQKFREEWARKYFALEFGESRWVFYLPASKVLLTAEVGK